MSEFTTALLTAARTFLGVKETTHNSGPEIDVWLNNVHQPPGQPWCAAFTYSMFELAARNTGKPNPCPRTAGALRMWELAPDKCRTQLPAPGDVFVLDHGGGHGHVGIVDSVNPAGDVIVSLEGNSNQEGSREGDSVVMHKWRPKDGKRGTLLGYLSLEPGSPAIEDTRAHDVIGLDALPKSPFSD